MGERERGGHIKEDRETEGDGKDGGTEEKMGGEGEG